VECSQQHEHEGTQRILQEKRAERHERLLAEIAIRSLSRWPQGDGMLSELVLGVLGVLHPLFQYCQGALTLREAFAMSFRLGLGYLRLFRLDRISLLVHPLLDGLQRLIEFLTRALLMPVGSNNFFAT